MTLGPPVRSHRHPQSLSATLNPLVNASCVYWMTQMRIVAHGVVYES